MSRSTTWSTSATWRSRPPSVRPRRAMCAKSTTRLMRVYLDHNATSPLKESARQAMLSALALAGNASSIHEEGRKAHALLDEARDAVARALGVIAPMVVFTAGGSEANNLALKGAPAE